MRDRLLGSNGLGGLGALAVGALGDTGGFTATVTKVVQLRAANGATAHDLDGVDIGRIDRENALDAFAVGNLADREALLEAAAVAGDADALIGLHAGALAFLDLHVHDHRVARLEVRNGLVELGNLLLLKLLNDVHRQYSCRRAALRGPKSGCPKSPQDFGVLL